MDDESEQNMEYMEWAKGKGTRAKPASSHFHIDYEILQNTRHIAFDRYIIMILVQMPKASIAALPFPIRF
jgi:hypothetical protein